MERFSHSSRRNDQYNGRVAEMATCVVLDDSGTAFDLVFIWLLLAAGRWPDWRANLPAVVSTWQRTSRRCWACVVRQTWRVVRDRYDQPLDRALGRALDRTAECCDRTPGARAS